jgi:hypothetical protein
MIGSPFAKKFAACFVAGLTTIALLLLLGNSGTIRWFPPVVVFSLVGIVFLISVSFPFIWQHREKTGKTDSEKMYVFLHALIRVTIAFNLASFGWKKIFGLQFVVPPEIASQPMSQQSGEWLTWYYFGYSPAFGLTIAAIQIIGSWFLLFRKTSLAASFVLCAFMLNLTLINIFYQMNAGASIQSLILTIGIIFLISWEYKKVLAVLFQPEQYSHIPFINRPQLKNLLRFSVIVLSLLFTLYLKYVWTPN